MLILLVERFVVNRSDRIGQDIRAGDNLRTCLFRIYKDRHGGLTVGSAIEESGEVAIGSGAFGDEFKDAPRRLNAFCFEMLIEESWVG